MTQTFKKTAKQIEANQLLQGAAKHILFRGGSRSGKTFLLIRALIVRALKEESRHVILRKHFAHAKQSVWLDTMPKVFDLCFPGVKETCEFNKSDWFVKFPNGSELWIGGLDDKERTEKILGKEFSTIFFNECSELSYDAVNMALTRLAQRNSLSKRVYYDCNPPKRSHWSHKIFLEKIDPTSNAGDPIADPDNYVSIKMNPRDNEQNIDPEYISGVLEKLPPLLRTRFLEGEYGSDDNDIFRPEWIIPSDKIPTDKDIAAKVTFVDPALTEKARATDDSCETGMVTVGIDYDGVVHDIEVTHGFWSYGQLKANCKATYDRHKSAPSYFFGVENVGAQSWLAEDLAKIGVHCLLERPDNDKIRRAISVTDIMEQGRCRVNDRALSNQLLGFPGEKLKDLVDAYVYCLKLVKRYAEDKYTKPKDKYEGLDPRSKRFWKDHGKQMDEMFSPKGDAVSNEIMQIIGN